jgi:hypothetical protein
MDTLAVLSGAIHPLLCTVRLWRPKAASIAAIGQPYATSVSTKTMVASGVLRLYKGVPLKGCLCGHRKSFGRRCSGNARESASGC